MLHIVEGCNYTGKTSTLEVLKKKSKDSNFIYHPRFNDAEFYTYVGSDAFGESFSQDIHRDLIYQMSHSMGLLYLKSIEKSALKPKSIVMDRCFASECVYNEKANMHFYAELAEILKQNFKYKIYYLYANEEQLKLRIAKRKLKDQITNKKFGIRSEGIDAFTAQDYEVQKKLDERYRAIFNQLELDVKYIDASNIKQSEVAKIILGEIKACQKTTRSK